MKYIWILYIIVSVYANAAQGNKGEDKITFIAQMPWHSDIHAGFELAKKMKKNLIVMIGEDDCRWCKELKINTLTDERVKAKLDQYVLVYIKRSDKASVALIQEFDGSIPSLFFMQSNRQLIDSTVGYFEADDFIDYMEEIEN